MDMFENVESDDEIEIFIGEAGFPEISQMDVESLGLGVADAAL